MSWSLRKLPGGINPAEADRIYLLFCQELCSARACCTVRAASHKPIFPWFCRYGFRPMADRQLRPINPMPDAHKKKGRPASLPVSPNTRKP